MSGWNPDLSGLLPGSTQNADPTSAAGVAGSAGIAIGSGTGQHGVIPLASNIGTGIKGAIQEFWDWVNEPFTQPMAPGSVFILVGVILVAIIAWNFIIYHVRIAAEAI